MRSLGTSIGAAVIGVILAQMTTTLGGVSLASEVGFRTALLVGGGLALVSAAIASFIPGVRPAASGTQETGTAAEPAQAKA
jgi:hypothetical protein